ncbi:hypothetical protein UlMin_023283 [Ulmus minor]
MYGPHINHTQSQTKPNIHTPTSPPWTRYFPSFLVFCFSVDTCFMMYYFLYTVSTYLKPHVAILNGITMGGEAGISILGTFRLVTYKTVFATPETLIGFHPDAGASFYLPRLPGHLGGYLGLTREKLSGEEMVACGVATHYSHSSRLQSIEQQLRKLVTDDPSMLETTLGKYGEVVYPEKGVLSRIEMIDKCFSHDTVEEIIEAGENEAAKTCDDWCTSTLRRLKEVSPLILKVSLRSIRFFSLIYLDDCLTMVHLFVALPALEREKVEIKDIPPFRKLTIDSHTTERCFPTVAVELVSCSPNNRFFNALDDTGKPLFCTPLRKLLDIF